MPSELVQRVRTKYPGAYDDLDDAALERAVLAKYPEYRDLVEPKPDFRTETVANAPGMMSAIGHTVGDVAMGALKGMGQTATNLGRAVHLIPGVSQAVDALYGAPVSKPSFEQANRVLQPTNAAQSIGKGAEQIGEFFIPAGAVSRASQGLNLAGRVGLEAATGAAVSAAQGASPAEIAASGVLSGAPTAIAPFGSRLTATIAERLKAGAAKRVTEGLGATTKRLKHEATRIAPEFAERGITGSLETIAHEAEGNVQGLGSGIRQAIKGPIGQQARPTAPIVSALEKAKGKLTTQNVTTGAAIVTDKPQHAALSQLQDVVKEYGDEMSVEQINALKKIYARVTSKAGGYNERAGDILNTAPEAARTFAAILRKEENGVEALAQLNKEFRFWKGVENVAKATVARRSSQTKGLTAAMAPVIGAAAGASSGDSVVEKAQNALIGGVAGRNITKALQSPQWKFVRAKYATKLADALVSTNQERIGQVVGKILAAEAAHVH